MRDVFLCYRAQGAQTAKLFMRYLQSKNYDDVWYSDTEAYGNYKNDIPELIGNAQSAVIFITKDFLNGFTEDSKDGYIECITKLEIIEIEKRIQQKDGFRVLTVFQDREGLSVEEQDILRSVFAESGILCPDSVSHFSQSNMVRFNSRKDVEENLFELLLKDLFPPEYFAKKT
ncbi:MAG: hypothetical protein IJE40_01930, partial [Clostridia bacterium]|nr:hypothetical protein [Clostridia bacterium]